MRTQSDSFGGELFGVIKAVLLSPFYYLYTLGRTLAFYRKHPFFIRLDLRFWFYRQFYTRQVRVYIRKLEKKFPRVNLVYGEILYPSLERIFSEITLPETGYFYDLGCGWGKTVFYVSRRFGLPSRGIDIVKPYILAARRMAAKYPQLPVYFQLHDFLAVPLDQASVVYAAWTCLDDDSVKRLTSRFESLEKGTIVITTSFSINNPCFEILKTLTLLFSWGTGTVYIHKKITT